MRQHSIDLLPALIRARSEAGLRTGRFITAAIAAIGVLIITATHSLFILSSAQENLFVTSSQAEEVFATEARAAELKSVLKRTNCYIDLYDRIALPVQVSSVMATVVNNLPDSVTLDQFDIDAGARTGGRLPRAKGMELKDEPPPRVLSAEISGFAANDQEIAELVGRLDGTPPFRDVNLDFSRTRSVNGHDAREFRLSFKIDLDARYEVSFRDGSLGELSAQAPPAKEASRGQ